MADIGKHQTGTPPRSFHDDVLEIADKMEAVRKTEHWEGCKFVLGKFLQDLLDSPPASPYSSRAEGAGAPPMRAT